MGLFSALSSGETQVKKAEGFWDSRLIGTLGLVLFLVGALIYVRAGAKAGVDFDTWYYEAGQRYAQGLNPYVLEGDPQKLDAAVRGEIPPIKLTLYPGSPTTCAMFAPFTLLPKQPAKVVWLMLTMSFFSVGIWLAMRVILTDWSLSRRLLLLGVTACAGSLRWNGGQAQVQPLVAGAFGILLYGVMRSKNGIALIGGALTFLKWNAFPPLFCLLLLRRRYRLLACILVLAVGIDVLAAAHIGIRETYTADFISLRNYATPGTNNYPDAHEIVNMLRGVPRPAIVMPGIVPDASFNVAGADFLHWIFLFSAFAPTMATASKLAVACSLLALIGLVVLAWKAGDKRDDPEFTLRFFAVAVCLGMLCVSHLKYDILMLVYPFFIALRQIRGRPRPEVWVLLAASFIPAYAIMGGVVMAWWLNHLVLPAGRIWLVPLYSYLVTLAFLAAFASAWRYATESNSAKLS